MGSPGPRSSRRATGASEIADGVFVGGWGDAGGFEGTRICVVDNPPAEPRDAPVHLPVYDPAKAAPIRANLDAIVRRVEAARAAGQPVLLYCGHGVRRGALAGAWYLHRHDRIPLAAAYERVRAVRPQVEPAEAWVDDLTPLEES